MPGLGSSNTVETVDGREDPKSDDEVVAKGSGNSSDDDQDIEDITAKIRIMRGALTNRMLGALEEEKERLRIRRETRNEELGTPAGGRRQSISAVDAERAGVAVGSLRDLKLVFDSRQHGRTGISEEEFTEAFKSKLCRAMGMTEVQYRLLFRRIDQDSNDRITWDEISTYLVQFEKHRASTDALFCPTTVEPEVSVAKGRGHPISVLTYAPSTDCFYSGGADGVVRAWQASNMNPYVTPIHETSTTVEDIVFNPQFSRLHVLHTDRVVFTYDCFLMKKRVCHELYRAHGSVGSHVKMEGDIAYYYRREENNPRRRRTVEIQKGVSSHEPRVPITMLRHGEGSKCIDHLGGLGMPEHVVIGGEDGTVELFNLHSSDKVIAPTSSYKVHRKGWVNKVIVTPELEGYVTAGMDMSIRLTDWEKGVNLMTMVLPSKKRPVFNFDYVSKNNTLVSCGGRSIHIWNALTGVKLITLNDHDSRVSKVSINANDQLVYAAMENKAIKVWDLRTWKALETIQDYTHRKPENSLTCLLWNDRHNMLVSGSGDLFSWRTVKAQDQLDAGLKASGLSFDGHMRSLLFVFYVGAPCEHIIGVDGSGAILWNATSGEKLEEWKWKMSSVPTAACLDHRRRKMCVGTDSGDLGYWNYASGHQIVTLKKPSLAGETITCVHNSPPVPRICGALTIVLVKNLVVSYRDDDDKPLSGIVPIHSQLMVPNEHGHPLSVCTTGIGDHHVAVGTQSGTLLLLHVATLAWVRTITPLSFCRSPVEVIARIDDGVFATLTSSGVMVVYGFHNELKSTVLAALQPMFADGEAASQVVPLGASRIAVGDTKGHISVFDLKRVLGKQNIRKYSERAAVDLSDEREFLERTSKDRVVLLASWKAHTDTVTCLSAESACIASGGVDRKLKFWKLGDELPLDCSIVYDLGYNTLGSSVPNQKALHQFNETSLRHSSTRLSFGNFLVGTAATSTVTSPLSSSVTSTSQANASSLKLPPIAGAANGEETPSLSSLPLVMSEDNLLVDSNGAIATEAPAGKKKRRRRSRRHDDTLSANPGGESSQILFKKVVEKTEKLGKQFHLTDYLYISGVRQQLRHIMELKDKRQYADGDEDGERHFNNLQLRPLKLQGIKKKW